MNMLKAGFSRVDITPLPPLGVNLGGYPHPESRLASEIFDALQINTMSSLRTIPTLSAPLCDGAA